jgi:hypothetical protein
MTQIRVRHVREKKLRPVKKGRWARFALPTLRSSIFTYCFSIPAAVISFSHSTS